MKRFHRIVLQVIIAAILWIIVQLPAVASFLFTSSKYTDMKNSILKTHEGAFISPLQETIYYLPWWLLISFGCYSLGTVAYNLLIFRECPNALPELEKDLNEARERLRKKGFKLEE
jgi:hypothetical protein